MSTNNITVAVIAWYSGGEYHNLTVMTDMDTAHRYLAAAQYVLGNTTQAGENYVATNGQIENGWADTAILKEYKVEDGAE